MPASSRRFIAGVAAILGIGALIGWLYGQLLWGLLGASLVVIAWQARQLLKFTQALHTGNFDDFRVGEGIWQQMFARFSFEHERATRAKREYRRLLKEIRKSTDAMPDGAVILDENHEIVMCNKAAKKLAGLKRKKDRGQRVDNILRDPQLVKLLQSGEFTSHVEIPSPVRDDAWLNCRIVPYGANQKLLIIRDVTERIRLSRMRRDFVANASHELRSPLTVISGYLDSLAEDDAIGREWGQPVSQMQEQSRRMNHIVGELLELSRLESAGRASTDEVVDVAGLLAAARKSYVGQKDVATIEVLAESTAQLLGRGNEIESLISNLLSNAIRHTPSSGLVTLMWRTDSRGAEIVVSDTGEGIPVDQIPRLTERFFRVDRGRAREEGGVGLGLAIVKHVLGRHDGQLSITSDIDERSEFRCRFPAERIVTEPPIPIVSESQAR
ncbi:MAG: phosphate regulon sensor histidine kinase PhoR [Woeseiaceae bacterium]